MASLVQHASKDIDGSKPLGAMDTESKDPWSNPLSLRVMGFCGVDDSVSAELLQILSIHYSWIEWGVLFRPDMEGAPRYATLAWVRHLSQINKDTGGIMRLAAHLCGSRCQEVIEGDVSFVRELAELGFGRVQVNATAANNVHVDASSTASYVTNLRACMAAASNIEWIIQCNEETKAIWQPLLAHPPSNMSVLFDASCGLGKLIDTYPKPIDGIPCGYAGGIGPDTIESVLQGVSSASNGVPVWVDMESSLRSHASDKANPAGKDVFSIEKAFQCVQIGCAKFQLPVSRFTLLSI